MKTYRSRIRIGEDLRERGEVQKTRPTGPDRRLHVSADGEPVSVGILAEVNAAHVEVEGKVIAAPRRMPAATPPAAIRLRRTGLGQGQ